ncbi:hypothetical protein [Solobacterium moorei]
MSNLLFLIIMVPSSLLFTCIGIYAWRRKKPMWFWAGDTVSEDEITDVRAYNRANGIMWICFSLPLWLGTIVGVCHSISLGGNIILMDGTVGLVIMMITYTFIRKKYKKI